MLSEHSGEDSSQMSTMFISNLNMDEFPWIRINSLLLITQPLVIGYPKPIRGNDYPKINPFT